jgi:hypothetical protein
VKTEQQFVEALAKVAAFYQRQPSTVAAGKKRDRRIFGGDARMSGVDLQ